MDDSIEEVDQKPNWKKRIGIAVGVLLALLVVGYFVGTSAAFLKGVILPRVGKQMNAEITVDDASVSPFSSVTLKNLRVKTTGTEPVVAVSEVRLRYGLIDIIKGHIRVDEATVDGAVINIVKEADGSSNLDPLTKKDKVEKEPSASKSELDIKNVALKNATLRLTQKLKGGGPNVTEISALNVTLDQLKNGGPGKLTIASDLHVSNRAPTGANSTIAAKISGQYDFTISQDLAPQTIKGSTKAVVSQADGAFKDANGMALFVDADATPSNLNMAAIRFERNGQALGQLRARGPFDMSKNEGALTVELSGLDRAVLNLAGASSGMDFAGSTISSTNKIELTRKATFVAVDGRVTGGNLGIIREGKPTPPIDLGFNYRVSADLTAQTAALEKISLSARHKGAEFLTASVDRPLNLSWGSSTYGLKDSTLRIALTNLNLSDWAPMLGTNPPTGLVNVGVKILAQEDGKKLGLDLSAQVNDLVVRAGTNTIREGLVTFTSKGTLEEMKRINLPEYTLQVRSNNLQVLQAKGAVRYDVDKKDYGLQLSADGALPDLLGQVKVDGIQSTLGELRVTANVTGGATGTQATGTASIEHFTGGVGSMDFQDFQTAFEYNIELVQNIAQIHRAALSLSQGFTRGGVIEVNGRIELDKKSGAATFKAVDVNQAALAPVLKSALGDKKLVSISLNSAGTATFSPGTNEIKAELGVTNLVVSDPAGTLPATPLGAGVNVDASMRGQTVEVRRMDLQLTPTSRATNQLQVSAKMDLATNGSSGVMAIKSSGLDVTRYYDIFAGNKTNAPAAKKTTSTAGANTSTNINDEPPAMNLPIKQLAASLAIDKLFLRDVAISNWVANVTISNNVVTLSPLKLGINGAPVTGSVALNLGAPGYTYDVALKADRVPLEPFANSFATTNAGQYKGFLVADATIRGAGVTGSGLQKNLQGQANFSVTNLDLKIYGPKLRAILVPISVVLRAPEILDTPINWIDAQTKMGDGKIHVEKMGVESEAFYANVTGDVTIDKVLTNSPLNLPVALSLRKSLAEKALLVNKASASDAKYAPLPNFVTIRGTLGKPDSDINKMALAGTLINMTAGLTKNAAVGNAAAALNALTGNSEPNTNAAGTNASAGSKLLQGLGGLLGGNKPVTNAPSGTNAPPVSTNAPATNAPVQNLLNLFKKTK